MLPKHLDEKVARLHLDALGVQLTELTPEQAAYIDVPVERPVQARPLPLLDPVDPNQHDSFVLRQRFAPVVNRYEFSLAEGEDALLLRRAEAVHVQGGHPLLHGQRRSPSS